MPTMSWIDATVGKPELAPLWTFLREQVEVVVDGRMDVRLSHLGLDSGGVRHPATRLLNDAALLAAAVREERTCDVMVLGCWGSPVTRVRAAIDVPVASLPEASAHAITTLARRAVVVTVASALVATFTLDLAEYGGVGLHPEPVISWDPESTHGEVVDAIESPGLLIDRFDQAARAAVDNGADAIVVGCGYIGPILAAHGYTHVRELPDIPVLDCNRLAAEHALFLYRLQSAGVRPAPRSYASPTGARLGSFRRGTQILDAG
jgi:Asp/Glu/hydantoin racemase